MQKMSPQMAIRILAQARVEKSPGNPKQARYDRARRLAIEALKAYSITKNSHRKEAVGMDKPIFRRFILIGNEKKENTLLALVKQKGLTREDLMLILQTIKIQSREFPTE